MVFVNTKREADRVRDFLDANGLAAEVISGDVPQKRRQKVLASFLAGELAILVTTDVGSRGLHIPGVSHVVNYDLPQDREDYVHRIGPHRARRRVGRRHQLRLRDLRADAAGNRGLHRHENPGGSHRPGRLPDILRPARSSRMERTEWGSRPPEGRGGRGSGSPGVVRAVAAVRGPGPRGDDRACGASALGQTLLRQNPGGLKTERVRPRSVGAGASAAGQGGRRHTSRCGLGGFTLGRAQDLLRQIPRRSNSVTLSMPWKSSARGSTAARSPGFRIAINPPMP
jgi:ATP-dependent RNA helicase RhlB